MRVLWDTHALLWYLAGDSKFTATALAVADDPVNERWLSPISLLEIGVKVSIGKLRLQEPFHVLFPSRLVVEKFRMLPVEVQHAGAVATLPLHHRDPFDRLIIAQGIDGRDVCAFGGFGF